MVIGVALTIAAGALAARRLYWLYRVARAGQPAPDRVAAVRGHPGLGEPDRSGERGTAVG
jgi:hypothetical protein